MWRWAGLVITSSCGACAGLHVAMVPVHVVVQGAQGTCCGVHVVVMGKTNRIDYWRTHTAHTHRRPAAHYLITVGWGTPYLGTRESGDLSTSVPEWLR